MFMKDLQETIISTAQNYITKIINKAYFIRMGYAKHPGSTFNAPVKTILRH